MVAKKFMALLCSGILVFTIPTALQAEVTTIALQKGESISVTIARYATVTEDGTLKDITIDEDTTGCLVSGISDEERTLVLSLKGTGYKFNGKPEIKLKSGFKSISSDKVKVNYTGDDNQVMYITLPYNGDTTKEGEIVLSNIQVKASGTVKDGDLNLKVGRQSENNFISIKVGQIKTYGITVEADELYSISAGDNKKVSFEIKENLADTLTSGRRIEFSLNKGYFRTSDGALQIGDIYLNGKNITKDVSMGIDEEEGIATGFWISIPELSESKNTIEIAGVQLCTKPSESGDIDITTSTRGIESVTTTLAEIEQTNNINISPINGIIGKNNQVGGKIIISETSNRSLEKGILKIKVEGEKYIDFTKNPKVKVTGDIEYKILGWSESEADGNTFEIKITKKSSKASEIQISDFTFYIQGYAPNGAYGVQIGGSAISPEDEDYMLTFDKFITLSESTSDNSSGSSQNNNQSNNQSGNTNNQGSNNNTNNQTNNQTSNNSGKVTVFKLNDTMYTVNGVQAQMEVAPYAQDGRIMIPLRYAAQAAGIADEDILYSNGVITLVGDKTIIMTLGSSLVNSNGEYSNMATAPTVINQRTFVPISEIANLLNIDVKWDSVNKTATFIN